MIHEIQQLKKQHQEDRTSIDQLLEVQNSAHLRLMKIEEAMEKSERRTRERNFKIFGIYEAGDGERTTDAEELVKTLNCFSVQHMWKLSDIESTHRIGQTRGLYRPLIVQFQSVDHKLSILRDQDLRESLLRNGIKVSTDLTPRQRDEIHDHKQAGRVAYFRSGRLHVEDKPAGIQILPRKPTSEFEKFPGKRSLCLFSQG